MRLALALLLSSLAANAAPAAAKGSASSTVEQSNEHVRAALTRYFKATGPAREKARTQARAAVSALIDFETLAKATMGDRWETLKPAERTRYTEALKGAMEASYLSRMKEQQGADVAGVKTEILSEAPQGDDVLVKTRVHSGQDTAAIDYLMHKEAKGFRAVDVVTEGTSLVDTYRESVGKLLQKKKFEGVVAALEKKRKQFEQESAAPASGPAPAAAPGSASGGAPADGAAKPSP